MPRGKSHSGDENEDPGSDLPALVDPGFVKAFDHVVRQHILLAAVQGEVSPNGLAKSLGEGLSQISYHVKVLRDDCGLLEETRTEQKRGAIEHYYRATTKSLLPAKAWRRLKKGLRAAVGAGQASDLFNDLADALKAGKLQGEHDQIARIPLALDAKSQRKVKAITERAIREVESEQRATAKRLEKANDGAEKTTDYTFALMTFESAWRPGDLRPQGTRTKGRGGGPGSGVRRNRSLRKKGQSRSVPGEGPASSD